MSAEVGKVLVGLVAPAALVRLDPLVPVLVVQHFFLVHKTLYRNTIKCVPGAAIQRLGSILVWTVILSVYGADTIAIDLFSLSALIS